MRPFFRLFPAAIVLFFLSTSFRQSSTFFERFVQAAIGQTRIAVTYVPAYMRISYPNGDVPANTGVCTDLVIRAYRQVGIDLQKEVHEDMMKQFAAYPQFWKLKGPDANIDHRRVPNLMCFFKRRNAALPVSRNAADYKPGDLVTWNLRGGNSASGITHIGVVTNIRAEDGQRYLVAHNIGNGNQLEDMLFAYTIIGHYRFGP